MQYGEQPSLSLALMSQQQQNQRPASSSIIVASRAEVEETVEGALLMLTLQFAQTTAGANLL